MKVGLQYDIHPMDYSFAAWLVRERRPDGEVL